MSATVLPDPKRYFEAVAPTRDRVAQKPPVCLYLEVTNRCNLLCETCPRTFEALEPPADMSWELFTKIVDEYEDIARVVLHGVGEPMLVKDLPRMIRYLKDRGIYVLFNTNGTLLAPRKRREIIDTGLDELRVSLDAADAATFLKVRGKDMFDRIVRNVGEFTALQKQIGAATPRVSLWLTGMTETIDQLGDFVRLAANIGVSAVHLQRLVFDDLGRGFAEHYFVRGDGSVPDGADGGDRAEADDDRLSADLDGRHGAVDVHDPALAVVPDLGADGWHRIGRGGGGVRRGDR